MRSNGWGAAGLAARYAAFAVIASAANIAAQWLSSMLYAERFEFYVALVNGTLVGLVVKYVLDRRWIFHDRTRTLRGHTARFTLYSLTGVFTTGVFWATEIAFAAMGDAPWLRYAGAAVGLAIGYALKYRLDKRFVFLDTP